MISRIEQRLTTIANKYISEKSSSLLSPKLKNLIYFFRDNIANCTKNAASARPPPGRVFANNYSNLNDVKTVGFDLDYTLVSYTVIEIHMIR